jgi:regulator of protease activity HflC (stomatin/prohibitin superfamily)
MISFIIFCGFALISLALLFRTRKNYNLKHEKGKWLTRPLLLIAIGFLVALANPFSLERVDAGHVGLKVNLTGDERGVSDYVYKTGWVVYNDWTERLYEFPTFQQHIDYNTQTVITKGGFSADIRPSFNYALVPNAVGDMFQNLRLSIREVEEGWLKTAIVGSVNDVANKWAVDSIFNHREQFEASIIDECNKRISKWFTVSQLRTNITPPPALQSAIEAKTKALQEVQVAENQKQVAIAEALRKIAIARGDSAQMVIEASGEAEAIRRKQLTLSHLYVEYLKVQKWDGKNPSTVLGKEGSTIISVK